MADAWGVDFGLLIGAGSRNEFYKCIPYGGGNARGSWKIRQRKLDSWIGFERNRFLDLPLYIKPDGSVTTLES